MTVFLQVICAAGGQQEHHTITQTRSGGVLKSGANRRQRIKGGFWQRMWLILLVFGGNFQFLKDVVSRDTFKTVNLVR